MITQILIALAIAFGLVSAPAVARPCGEYVCNCFENNCGLECECGVCRDDEWSEFHDLAVVEYEDEFTALFNSYETKWSKNNRLMIRQGDSGSFKFAKRGN